MEKSGKFRLTSLERNWILYDVGNSAFVLMVATLIPIFFNALAEAGGLSSVEYLAYWGYASSAVTVITAVLSPILGTVADTKGFKKPIFILCVFVGIVGCCAMGAASAWLPFLVIFVIAKVGFSGSLVFYDSMLSDVTTPERMDEVSSRGYATSFITWVMGASPRSAEKAAPSTSARGPIVYRPVPSSCRRYRRSSSVCTMGNRLLFGASRACDNSVSVKPSSEPDRLSRISKTRAVARCCPCVISCSFHAGALRRRLISPGRSYQMPLRLTSGHAPPPCFPTGGILPDLLLTFSAVLLY